MKKLVLGFFIGLLVGSFVKIGMFIWLALGAVIMYIAFKKQLVK